MKKILYLLCVCALCACETNEPNQTEDPATKNQPAHPDTWSPVGKTYVCDWGDNSEHNHRYVVLDFFSADSVCAYASNDLGSEKIFSFAGGGNSRYDCSYPKLNILHNYGSVLIYCVFADTLTLNTESGTQTFILQ